MQISGNLTKSNLQPSHLDLKLNLTPILSLRPPTPTILQGLLQKVVLQQSELYSTNFISYRKRLCSVLQSSYQSQGSKEVCDSISRSLQSPICQQRNNNYSPCLFFWSKASNKTVSALSRFKTALCCPQTFFYLVCNHHAVCVLDLYMTL